MTTRPTVCHNVPMRQLLLAVICLCLLASCSSDSGSAPVPRPRAYPRIEAYPAEYRPVDSLALSFEANSSARVRIKGPAAADIIYPRYNATVYVSVISLPAPDSAAIARALSSRLERAAMNLGATQAHTIDSTSGDFDTQIIRADGAVPTPVQLIATDYARRLLTATAFVEFIPSPSATDSLAPVIDALQADLTHLAATLR